MLTRPSCYVAALFVSIFFSARGIAQSPAGCAEPSPGSGLIIGRALQQQAYHNKRVALGIETVNPNHVRALTDPDATQKCESLRSMLRGWPGRAADTNLHFFVADGVYFVTAEQLRLNPQDKETRPPQLLIVKGNKISSMIIRRHG